MIWLFLAIACSLSIAMLFKYSERRGLDRTALLTVNYFVASFVSIAFLAASRADIAYNVSVGLVVLGIGTGVLFIVGFMLFAYAIGEAGMGLATGVMRISVVLPVLASWLVWKETPSSSQMVGLLLAGAAFFLIARRDRPLGELDEGSSRHGRFWTTVVLGLLFLAGGIVDVSMKTFGEVYAPTNDRAVYLLLVFSVAFLIGLALVVTKRKRTSEWPEAPVYGWGIALGVVNYGSAAFLLGAISELPGPFVFPVNNIAIVGGAAALGVGIWGEELSFANWIGLTAAAVALALLWV